MLVIFDKTKLKARQERFSQDVLPIQLGNLASNLARLQSFALRPELSEAAQRVTHETKHFSEWAANHAELTTQLELLELQRQLVYWQRNWMRTWNDQPKREALAAEAAQWSQRILTRSGLLTPAQA